MSDPVKKLHEDLSEAGKLLAIEKEISLGITLKDIHRKSLLLAAASYFENKLSEDVLKYCQENVGTNSPLANLVKSKAINRQYHTWFSWEQSNANSFFALFGQDFKKHMESMIKEDVDLADAVKQFLMIGSDRNRLVHQNFGAFTLEADADDIMLRFDRASLFVHSFAGYLRAFSERVREEVST